MTTSARTTIDQLQKLVEASSGIKGDQGSVVDVGGNVYAGHDGNVYKHTDSGREQMAKPEPRSQYQRPQPTQTRSLDQDRFSRDMGAQRYQFNRGASGMMHRSFGGRRR